MQREEVAPIAPRAGADLRAARERVGWALGDLAQAMNMRPSYLEALEAGRINELPGNAYVLAFLRAYATMLGLDPDEVVRRFKAEAAQVNARPELIFPVPVPERRMPAGAVVLLGLALAVATYAGWYRLSGEGRLPAEANIQVPRRLAPLADQALRPEPRSATAGGAAPAPVAPAPVQDAESAPPVPAISPSSAAAAVSLPAPPEPARQPHIVLRANADAWLQVRDRSGQVLLSRVLRAGETWDVPEQPNLLLTTGNAGGTDLLIDGTATGSLGGSGVVRRDLPLDPDLIRDGKLLGNSQRPGPQ
ncbi:MAG TPA: RodZ domain-containing protein [Acetobacteraceae bacterium]|nr:RodZ domain-containing protein [Acetobacteraceae bacterium]